MDRKKAVAWLNDLQSKGQDRILVKWWDNTHWEYTLRYNADDMEDEEIDVTKEC